MSEPEQIPQEIDTDALDELYGLSDELINDIETALAEERDAEYFDQLLDPLHSADIADLLEQLKGNDREKLIEIYGPEFETAFYGGEE